MPTSQLREQLRSSEWIFTFSSLSLCLGRAVRALLHRTEQFFGGAARVSQCDLCLEPQWQGRVPQPYWGSRQEGGTFPSESFVKISLLCCAHFTNPPRWEPGTSDGMELWRERFQGSWWRRVVRDGKQVILIHPPPTSPTTSKVTFKMIRTCPKYKSLLLQNIT